uniref:Centromere protein M n=1 Tax=Oryzias melastigma TaxID=30732 RepID=A0A3B3DMX6_ORYME
MADVEHNCGKRERRDVRRRFGKGARAKKNKPSKPIDKRNMSRLNPFAKLPGLNAASVLLVENEEHFQQSLAEALVKETSVTVNVRLAKSFPLPVENDESRPRIDLVVFIINLTSELSFQSAEASLKYLEPGYFLGKVCFMVSNARSSSVPAERLDAVRRLAASLHCPLLFAEDQVCETTKKCFKVILIL